MQQLERLMTLLAGLGPSPDRPGSYNIAFPSPQLNFI